MTFPINRVNERTFEPGWSGEVFVCDIDRTYLYTRFSSLKGLAQIPFEFAVDKKEIEGMAPLLREVRRGPEKESRHTPLYFVSASPAQLRPVIQRKMLLDGLEFDGTIFKDWLGVLSSLRLRRLKEQLGFKLTALLLQLEDLPTGARQVLIGDDLEADALVFTLFADAIAGRLDARQLLKVLLHNSVALDDAKEICGLVERAPRREVVKRAYIRMERHESAEAFLDFWPHVVVCRGAFQMAVALWGQGSIAAAGVVRVVEDLHQAGYHVEEIEARLIDCCRRGLVERQGAGALLQLLGERSLVSSEIELPEEDQTWREASSREADRPWTPSRLL